MAKVIFFGTPSIAVPFLEALHRAPDFEVVGVVTQPDKPVGRKAILTPSAVSDLAATLEIPVFKPERLKENTELADWIRTKQPDAFVIFAYGRIIPQAILDLATKGSINVHPSKLPELRGPSPIASAIRLGLDETAISIMLIDDQMDHGPLLAQEVLSISETDTTESLSLKIEELGPDLLITALRGYLDGSIQPVEQDHGAATLCKMIEKSDGLINPEAMTAKEIVNLERAFSAWPGVQLELNGVIHKVSGLSVAEASVDVGIVQVTDSRLLLGTSSRTIAIEFIQPPGKTKMPVKAFLNGLGPNPTLEVTKTLV